MIQDILPHYEVTGDGPGKTGQWGARATDLGYMTQTNHGWVMALFGDTFVDKVRGTDWRSPTAFRTHNSDIQNGIRFDNAVGGTHAKQIIDYHHGGKPEAGELPDGFTNIPNDMVHLPNGLYLMSTFAIKSWDPITPGKSWATFHSRFWQSTETNAEVWTRTWDNEGRHQNFDFPNSGIWSHFQNVSFLKYANEPWLYIYGTNEGRWLGGGIHLMRVPFDKWNVRSAYETWGMDQNKHWAWRPVSTGITTPILLPTPVKIGPIVINAGRIGEINAQFIDGQVVLTFWDETIGAVSRVSPRPEGLWSDPKFHARPDAGYSPCVHPYSHIGNAEMLISQWKPDDSYYGTKQYHADLTPVNPKMQKSAALRATDERLSVEEGDYQGDLSRNLSLLDADDIAALLSENSDYLTQEEALLLVNGKFGEQNQ